MTIAYPIDSTRRRRGIDVTFPDLPEALAQCAAGEEMDAAVACLVAALAGYVRERRAIPRPSNALGRPLVPPPLLVAAKVALYQEMHRRKLSNVALAKQLGTVEGSVRRLVDLHHRSHVDQVEGALALLGKRLFVSVRRA
ncbi:MAG: type II toxin-antitoxin system HicB family antitoxin [Pseudomonadales bacterium]|nr:type II toxin-antitoxin system HicB family antitoxin [Pseudomonadales bacterium]